MATPPAHPRTPPKPKATAQAQAAPPPARHPQTPLYMGIDLGTSHSAVVASNGARHVIESYVGWPVDAIARRVVKIDWLREYDDSADLENGFQGVPFVPGGHKPDDDSYALLKHGS